MKRAAPIAFISLLLVIAQTNRAYGDGGTLRVMQQQGELQIAVFTSPAILRAGPADVSVLVQDAETAAARLDAEVTILATHPATSAVIERRATTSAATNKLLQAAKFELPYAGPWRMEVAVKLPDRSAARVSFQVEAAPPASRWTKFWPWFTWPAVAMVLFCVHQWLTPAKQHSRTHR